MLTLETVTGSIRRKDPGSKKMFVFLKLMQDLGFVSNLFESSWHDHVVHGVTANVCERLLPAGHSIAGNNRIIDFHSIPPQLGVTKGVPSGFWHVGDEVRVCWSAKVNGGAENGAVVVCRVKRIDIWGM